MNRQEIKTPSAGVAPSKRTSQPHAPHRHQPNPKALRRLYFSMLTLAAMIVLVGLLLVILPCFRVKTIAIEGELSYYKAEEIILASGIEEGQEILAINVDEVCESIWNNCKYIDEIRFKRGFFGVTITVVERKNIMYTAFNGKYYSLDQSLTVLEQAEDEQAFSGFLKVSLPLIRSIRIGYPLQFEKETMDYTYISELVSILDHNEKLSSVTSIDFSKKYSVSYVMNKSCRVEIGKVDGMANKLELVDGILEIKGDLGGSGSVVDVSDPGKPTFRLLNTNELLAVR